MNIAALISGGVDSAVAVRRLLDQGHDPHLFYIRIGMDDDSGDCSTEEDIEMCSYIARQYALPFDVVPLHQEYWDNVMEYALRTVREGFTPNPDIMCNKMIKFGFFEQRWGKDFDLTATGHYARVVESGGKKWLGTAPDPVKDQTDFLAQISYDQLCHITFPIGDLPKAEVRRIAAECHLPNAGRKDSQGICFLGKINYNDFIRRHLGEKAGPIIEIETGRKLGEHKGFWFHTIGQRKGLGLSGGPWYVVKKNAHENIIYVSNGYGTEKQYGRTIFVDDMHFITADPWGEDCKDAAISFKNRHMPQFIPAKITRLASGEYRIDSEQDVQGIAPGQFCVAYDPSGSICYGSGVIVQGKGQ
ncbi:MAG: tRNA 2-thiouridine(34) synthase MnmA [Clostridium sp.]|nr:tRNA 2-thiouridine(34) synthase MnmA [Clostridium sp.]